MEKEPAYGSYVGEQARTEYINSGSEVGYWGCAAGATVPIFVGLWAGYAINVVPNEVLVLTSSVSGLLAIAFLGETIEQYRKYKKTRRLMENAREAAVPRLPRPIMGGFTRPTRETLDKDPKGRSPEEILKDAESVFLYGDRG